MLDNAYSSCSKEIWRLNSLFFSYRCRATWTCIFAYFLVFPYYLWHLSFNCKLWFFYEFFHIHLGLALIHLDKLNFCYHLHQPLIHKFYLYFITGGFYMSEVVTVKVLCLVAVFFQGVSGAAIPTPLLWFPEFFWVLVYW